MHSTCKNVLHMAKMVQIRHVPEDVHRTLKARAAREGMSLSDYLLTELRKVAQRPTPDEIRERLAKLEPVEVDEPPEVTIRRDRERG